MIGSRKKLFVLGLIVLGLIVFGVAFLALRFSPSKHVASSQEGDVIITDNGFLSHPRYEIRFPKISLMTTGTHGFELEGLPNEKLRLFLEMPDLKTKMQQAREFLGRHPDGVYQEVYDEKKHKAVEGNRTVIQFTMVADGQTIANVTAPLSEWRLDWRPGTNTGQFYYNGGEFVFHSKVKYQVTFEIKEVDPDGTPSELLPVFKGGGMEW